MSNHYHCKDFGGLSAYRQYLRGLVKSGYDIGGTLKSAMARAETRTEYRVWCKFQAADAKRSTRDRLASKHIAHLPASEKFRQETFARAKADRPRVQRWSCVYATTDRITSGYKIAERYGSYSKRCRYVKTDYDVIVQAYGYVRRDGVLVCRVLSDKYEFLAPRGWEFVSDEHGLAVRRSSCHDIDYHLTADDVRYSSVAGWCAKARENHQERKAALRQKRMVEKLPDAKTWVCVADSRRGGNCLAGTLNFAAAHKLDPGRHIRADVLRRLATSAPDRVSLAITAAKTQAVKEYEQGFALLQDHYHHSY